MATRERVADYDFFNEAGESLGPKACPEAVGIHFNFLEPTGKVNDKGVAGYKTIRTESITFANFPDDINAAWLAHGAKQKGADLFAGAKSKGEDPAEMFLAGVEHLEMGNWLAATRKGGAGPRISQLKQALANVLVRDYGHEAGEALNALVAKQVATEDGLNGVKAHKDVMAELARIKAAAAAAIAEKLAQDAQDAADDDDDTPDVLAGM